ncbi:MAG: PDZ domain-containing protein, partial [Planctomycetota bacterium]
MKRFAASFLIVVFVSASCAEAQQTREEKVRADRARIEAEEFWIYNDLEAGLEEAREAGKPVLVTLRCLPCEACAKLDEEVAERDPRVRDLLDEFVCVRMVHANGMDLSLFQFDYDQSWAAFVLHADKTIIARYGTRSHQTESDDDVSVEGFAKTLKAALAIHDEFSKHRDALAAKRGPAAEIEVPENLPTLEGRYGSQLDYEGQVVKSCIHCHQVGDALRAGYLLEGEPIPEKLLFPYPNPKQFGLIMDPQEKSTVLRVEDGSHVQEIGFEAGDEIVSLEGQPVLSTADIQWVLHHADDPDELTAEVKRDGETFGLSWTLPKGWRRAGDISWRVSSWPFRRIATGGLVLEDASGKVRRAAGVSEDDLALLVTYVGQYNEHAAAKRAGFEKGDVIVSYDGLTVRMTEG